MSFSKITSPNFKPKGLTLVEILIFISVVVVISSIVWGGLSSYRDSQALSTGAEIILSALSESRAKTISSEGDRQYGLYLSADRVTIFPGTEFTVSSSNKEFGLGKTAVISSTDLAISTSTIVFEKRTGQTANYGTITISLRNDPAKTKIISISRTGGVSVE